MGQPISKSSQEDGEEWRTERIRLMEWIRAAALEDVLALEGAPPDAAFSLAAAANANGAKADDDNDDDDDIDPDDSYCAYCTQYGHVECDCPLLNPALDGGSESSSSVILSSSDASLMEGLVEDDMIRRSFLVSLSSDLLAQTDSERPQFAAVQAMRLAMLRELNAALTTTRRQARASKPMASGDVDPMADERTVKPITSPPKADGGEKTEEEQEEDDDVFSFSAPPSNAASPSSSSASSALLLRMCIDLLASRDVTADSGMCMRLLSTLRQVLSTPSPLSLRTQPETTTWARNVAKFLLTVAANPDTKSEKAKQAQRQAIMMLLKLVIQTGSLLTALQTVQLLGLKQEESASSLPLLTAAESASLFSTFSELEPSLDVLSRLSVEDRDAYHLAGWEWTFPNASSSLLGLGVRGRKADSDPAIKSKRSMGRGGRRGRGRHRAPPPFSGRGRAPRRKKAGHHGKDDDDDDDDKTAYSVTIATDGTFLFVHSSDYGLARVGSGYHGSRRGYTYAHIADFGHGDASNRLAFLTPFLYYRSERTGTTLIKIDPKTLEVVEEIQLASIAGMQNVHPDSPLTSCHRFLYLIGQVVRTPAVQPDDAELNNNATSLPVPDGSVSNGASVSMLPSKRRHPDFQLLVLDPSDGCKLVRKQLLHNPSITHEENEASTEEHKDTTSHALISTQSSTALPSPATKRSRQRCPSCERFHTCGPFFTNGSGRMWCGHCHMNGLHRGRDIRSCQIDTDDEQTSFPSFSSPTITGQGPTPRFGHTAVWIPGMKIATTEEQQEEAEEEEDGEEEREHKTSDEAQTNNASSSSSSSSLSSTDSSTMVNNIWLFGGASGRPLPYTHAVSTIDLAYNDVFVLNADDHSWHSVDVSGEAPAPRLGHSCTRIGEEFWIIGGGKDDTGEESFNDVFAFDTLTRTWTKKLTSGTPPEPRLYHAAILIGEEIIIHGGKGPRKVLSDVFVLNIRTLCWTQIKTTGIPSPQRHGHYMEVRDDPTSSERNALSIYVMGGCGNDQQSNSQLPQFKLEIIPSAESNASSAAAAAVTSPSASSSTPAASDVPQLANGRFVWSLLGKVTVYHVMAGSVFATIDGKLWVLFGSHNNCFVDKCSTYDWSTGVWDEHYNIAGMSMKTLGLCAYAIVDTRVYIFHGADYNGACNDVMVLETNADPAVPLTQAAMKDGQFYTNGRMVNVLIPPLISPNVVLNKEYMVRTFSVDTGAFLYDTNCGAQIPGHAVTFDPINNVIWSYDAATNLFRRWCNNKPSPSFYTQDDEKDVVVDEKGKQTLQLAMSRRDLSLRLLAYLDRFSLFFHPPPVSTASVFDPRRFDDSINMGVLIHEACPTDAFAVELEPQSFCILHALLRTAMEAIHAYWDMKQQRRQIMHALQCILQLLSNNTLRLCSRVDFTLQDVLTADGQPLHTALLDTLTTLADVANQWSERADGTDAAYFARMHVSCMDTISIGLAFFLPAQSDRVAWFHRFLQSHLPAVNDSSASASSIVASKREVLRVVLDRLIFNRRASHELLAPASSSEGALSLQVVSVYEPEAARRQSSVGAPTASGVLNYGEEDDQDSFADILLDPDEGSFVARSARRVHVVLSHRFKGRLIQPTSLTMRIEGQQGNTAEVRDNRRARNLHNALIFVLNENDWESVVERTAAFDSMTEEKYDEWRAGKIARGEAWNLATEPVGWVQFDTDADLKAKEKKQTAKEEEEKLKRMHALPSLDDDEQQANEEDSNKDSKPSSPSISDLRKNKKYRTIRFDPVLQRHPKTGELVMRRATGSYILLKLLRAQPEVISKTKDKKKKDNEQIGWGFSVGPMMQQQQQQQSSSSSKSDAASGAAGGKSDQVSKNEEPCIMLKRVAVRGSELDGVDDDAGNGATILPSKDASKKREDIISAALMTSFASKDAGASILRLLLDRAAEHARAALSAPASAEVQPTNTSHPSRLCLNLLQLMQADILSRAADCLNAQQPSTLYAAMPTPVCVMLDYVAWLLDASESLIRDFNKHLSGVSGEDELQTALNRLSNSSLRHLLPSLLAALVFFSQHPLVAIRILPAINRLLQAMDSLALEDGSKQGNDKENENASLSPIGKLFIANERLYLANDEERLRAHAQSVRKDGVYPCGICLQKSSTENAYVSHLLDSHVDFAQRVSRASNLSTPWLLDTWRQIGSLGGRCSATLIRGLPVTRREQDLSPWLDCPIMQGGLTGDYHIKTLKQRQTQVRKVAEEQSGGGVVCAWDSIWESTDVLDAESRASSTAAVMEEKAFMRHFLGLAKDDEKAPASVPSAGIRLLSQLRTQLPVQASGQLLPLNLPGWSLAQLLPGGAQSKQKRIPFHPAVDRALRYARIALLKQLGLLPEAMLFAQLLAKQQSSLPVAADGTIELAVHDLPSNLRPVWLYTHLLHLWIMTHAGESSTSTASRNDEEEKKTDGATPSPSSSPSSSSSSTIADPLVGVSRGIIERAICLLRLQPTFPSSPVSAPPPAMPPSMLRSHSALHPRVDPDSDALPPLHRGASTVQTGAFAASGKAQSYMGSHGSESEAVRLQRERTFGDALQMWESILGSPAVGNSNAGTTGGGDRPTLGLQRQLSMSKRDKTNDNKNKTKLGFGIIDWAVQFLRSDQDIDPVVAAEKEKAAKKRASAVATNPDADSNSSNQDGSVVKMSPSELLDFLLVRRHRALMRSVGFRFLSQLLSTPSTCATTSPFLSVQHELVRFLPAALRGQKDKETNDSANATWKLSEEKALEVELGSDSEPEDAFARYKKKKKDKEDEAKTDNKSGFHFSQDTASCGLDTEQQLAESFQLLFAKLVVMLSGQVKAVSATMQPQSKSLSSPVSSPSSPHRALTGGEGGLSSIPLSLSILASLGMSFRPADHTLLDNHLVHCLASIRTLMDMEVAAPAAESVAIAQKLAATSSVGGQAKPNAAVGSASARPTALKLKESAWAAFRLLAISAFTVHKQSTAMGTAPAHAVTTRSTAAPHLSKFQASLLELTFSIIHAASQLFLERKTQGRPSQIATDSAEQKEEDVDSNAPTPTLSRSGSRVSRRRGRAGSDGVDGSEADDEADENEVLSEDESGLGSGSGGSDSDERKSYDEDEDEESDDDADEASPSPTAASGSGGLFDAASASAATVDDSASALSSLFSAEAPGETAFGMLRLVLSMCGAATLPKGSKPSVENKLDEKSSAERQKAASAASGDDSVLRYLSSSTRFLNLLATLLAHGTPRIQRLSVRLMRRLLPLCTDPDALQLSGLNGEEGAEQGIATYLMHLIGKLLCANAAATSTSTSTASEQHDSAPTSAPLTRTMSERSRSKLALSHAQKERSFHTAQVSSALASELIALMRILFACPSWTASLQRLLLSSLEPLPALLRASPSASDSSSSSPLSPSSPALRLCMASLSVMGGIRPVLRVGGKVWVMLAKNKSKRKLATLLSYDAVAATASVVYDAVATKSVATLKRGHNIVACEEAELDTSLLPLDDAHSRPLIDAFRVVLSEILQEPAEEVKPTPAAAAAFEFALPGDDPAPSTSSSVSSSAKSTSLARTKSTSESTSPAAALVQVQLRSRVMRVLCHLLAHKPSAHAIVAAGFGPILSRVAQLRTSLPLANPGSQQLEESERRSDRLAELCQEHGLLFKLPDSGDGTSLLAQQAANLPFNPYRSFAPIPSRMTSEDPLLVIEDGRHQLVTTGRVQAWEDEVAAGADIPIPDTIPSFYFEVEIMNRGTDGNISIGLTPASKKVVSFPGSARMAGSCGLYDNGYVQLDRKSINIEWGPGASESASYWADGDCVGMLYNMMTGQISVVHNGIIKEDVIRLPTHKRYRPCVCVGAAGIRLYVNFGQRPFRYDFGSSKHVPPSLGGSMSLESLAASDARESSTTLASSPTRQSVGSPTVTSAAGSSSSASASAPDSSADPFASKKKLLLEAEEAEKKKQEEEAKKKVEEEEKKDEEEKKEDEDEEKKGDEEKKEEEKSPSDDTATVSSSAARTGPITQDVSGADSSNFDAWRSEDEFSEEEDADDEDASDDGHSTDDDGNAGQDPYGNDDYDEYGRPRSRKKARLPPLTIADLTIGMVVAIKPQRGSDGGGGDGARNNNHNAAGHVFGRRPRGADRRRQGAKGKNDEPARSKLAGTVVAVDQPRRRVLLSVYWSESGLARTVWLPIAAIRRLKPRINADLYEMAKLDSQQMLPQAIEQEHCLTVTYAVHSMLTILNHGLQKEEENKQQTASASASAPSTASALMPHVDHRLIELDVMDVGGVASLCACLKRTALDEVRANPHSSLRAGASEYSSDEVTSQRPIDILRRFIMQLLRTSSHASDLAAALKAEALRVLDSRSSSTDWMERVRSRQLITYGIALVDLLLTIAEMQREAHSHAAAPTTPQKPKPAPVAFCLPGEDDDDTQQEAASSAATSPQHVAMPIFSADIYNALVTLLNASRKAKVYKPSAQDVMVFPLVSRLLTGVEYFPRDQRPDVSALEWLHTEMQIRHALEIKHGGAQTAVSKPLQTIISTVLCMRQAQQRIKELEQEEKERSTMMTAGSGPSAAASASTSLSSYFSSSYSSSSDPFDIGPTESLNWFDGTRLVTSIMSDISRGIGVAPWFVRLAWLDMQVQRMAVSHESAHPYVSDVKWTPISVEHAEKLVIRLDAKCKVDQNDKLKFAVLKGSMTTETSPHGKTAAASASSSSSSSPSSLGSSSAPPSEVKSSDLFEIASFSGPDMANTGVGTAVLKGQSASVKGQTVYFSFEQSRSPVHPNCFCAACDFPIRGDRLICAHCDGSTQQNHRRRRYDGGSENYSLCAACEASNQDSNKHDRTHVFVAVRRPLPRSMVIPRVAPSVNTIYSSTQSAHIKAGSVANVDQQTHVGSTCSVCAVSPIVGVRYRCSVCPSYDVCSSCYASPSFTHDRSHPLFKLRHPVQSALAFSGVLKSFVGSTLENDTFWGWRFQVIPSFPSSYIRQLMEQHVQELDASIRQMKRADRQGLGVAMDTQCVEIINRAVTKLISMSSEKKQSGGGRRARRRHDEEEESAVAADAEYISSMLEPDAIVTQQKDLSVYSHLQNCSIEEVHMRMAVLKALNTRLSPVLPLIDWSLVGERWSLSYVFGQLRGLVFSQLKQQLWRAALTASSARTRHRAKPVELDNIAASRAREMASELDVLDVVDQSLFGQLFSQVHRWSADSFRTSGQPWMTRFKGESGYDAGGLFRDALAKVSTDLQSEHLPLFIPCPNKVAGVGITLDKFIPSPKCSSDLYIQMYSFVGRLMGVAIRTNNTLELDLPSMVWKPLVGQPLEVADLTAIDQLTVNNMLLITDERKMAEKGIDESNFEDAYGFVWSYSSFDGSEKVLKENGSDLPVTWEQRHEYSRAVLDFRLHELSAQVRALRAGLTAVIPSRFLAMLTWKELELQVCGSPEIDIDVLRANTVYSGCSPSDLHIIHFWAVLTSFSQLERAQFLRFIWGRSRLPPKLTEKMRIDSTSNDTTHLPQAHTCFFSIELPRYPTEDMMRDKLSKAITLCTSMELI